MTGSRPLIIGLGWTDRPGGLERYVAELRSHLDDPPTIVLGPATDPPSGVHVPASQDDPLVARLWAVRRAAGRLSGDVDVLDTQFPLTGLAARSHRRVRALPTVVHFQGPWADEAGGSWWRAWLERLWLRRVERVVVLSAAMGRTAIERRGVSPWRLAVIAPGVDLPALRPEGRNEARARLGIEPGAFVAVCVRRLVPRTGVDVLVEAWAASHGRLPEGATLLIAGSGPEAARLAALVRDRPGTDAIRLLGIVPDATVADLHAAADVAVIPTRAMEGFGLVALEAMAHGTPVIATRVDGLPEAVHGTGCPLVPPDDPAGLAEALVEVAAHPLDRARCRRRADLLPWSRAAERHRSLFADVAARRPPAGRRVVLLDHVAGTSGGEIALARLVDAVTEAAPGAIDFHAVLFEPGPLATELAALDVTHEVRPLGPAGGLDRHAVTRPLTALRYGATVTGFTLRLAWRLRRLAPELVHANSLKAGIIGGVASRLAGVPMVWHVRDRLTADYLGSRTAAIATRAVRRLATTVVVPSATVAATVPTGPSAPPVRIVRDPYRRPEGEAAPVRHDGDEPLLVVIIGRLAPWKGQDILLRAWAAAAQRRRTAGRPRSAARLVIAGAPLFDVDRAYADSLPDLVAGLGLDDDVDLAGWCDDVPGLLSRAAIAVHASTVPEPHGQVVLEAMAAGVPVIASGAGGPTEMIRPGIDGLLVPPGDPEALAVVLDRLVDDPATRRRLGRAGAIRARSLTDPRAASSAILDVYAAAARTGGRR